MSTSSITPPVPHVAASQWLPLPVALAGTFMVVVDFFIVNVALPSIQSRLHADGALEWAVAGYAPTSAIFMISGARLGDRLGHRQVFSLGLGLFTLAPLGCGAAAAPDRAGGRPAAPGLRRRAAHAYWLRGEARLNRRESAPIENYSRRFRH